MGFRDLKYFLRRAINTYKYLNHSPISISVRGASHRSLIGIFIDQNLV
jgi:hypothetical protein